MTKSDVGNAWTSESSSRRAVVPVLDGSIASRSFVVREEGTIGDLSEAPDRILVGDFERSLFAPRVQKGHKKLSQLAIGRKR
jgi:hypothetical protein